MKTNTIRFTCTSLANTGKKGIVRKDANGYYDMVIGGLNVLNSAGEYYEYEGAKELFNSSSTLMRRVSRGSLRGEVGHPKRDPNMSIDDYINRIMEIRESNVCVHFREIYLDFESFKDTNGSKIIGIRAWLTPSGPKGDFLKKAIENPNENVAFSIRSFTENTWHAGRTNKVLKTIVSWDYVNEPGIAIANKYSSPTLESYQDLSLTQNNFDRALDKRHEMALSQESSFMSKEELYSAFGWSEKPKARFTTW